MANSLERYAKIIRSYARQSTPADEHDAARAIITAFVEDLVNELGSYPNDWGMRLLCELREVAAKLLREEQP